MASDMMLTGIIIVTVSALVGIVGVLSNTQKNQGLKWALLLLLVAGAAAGINKEFQADAAAKAEKKRAEEALKIAGESSKMVETGIQKQEEDRQKYAEDREKLEADLKKQQDLLESLVGQIVALSTKLEEMGEAAEKAKKSDIAEIGINARIDASTTLLKLARKEQWMTGKDLKKMESSVKKKTPLTAADMKVVQAKMKLKHLNSAR